MAMDVYDFDGTLYRGDSTLDFLMWSASRHPRIMLTLARTGFAAAACFGAHIIDKTRFKSALYRSLRYVPDIEREVERFWVEHERLIAGPCAPHAGDVVVSGGPEFLLRSVCAKRGLVLISSKVDPHTGRVLSPNCSGPEKVTRFREAFPDAEVDRFFSNSHSDDPFAALAHEAYLVHDGQLAKWQF